MGEGTYISHVTEEEGEAETERFVQHDLCSFSFTPSFANFLAPVLDLEHSSVPLDLLKEQGLCCLVYGFRSPAWATRGFAVTVPQQGQAAWPKSAGLSLY